MVQENINQVIKRSQQLNEIEQETNDLKNMAKEFNESTASLERKMRCKKIALWAGIGGGCGAIAIVVAVWLIIKFGVKK